MSSHVQRFRANVRVLAALLLPILIVLYSRIAPETDVFGRWSYDWAVLIGISTALVVGFMALSFTLKPAGYQRLLSPIRLIQRWWWLVPIGLLVMVEAAYRLHDLLLRRYYVGQFTRVNFLMVALIAASLWAALMLLLTGRDDPKAVLFPIMTVALMAGILFVFYALGYSLILHGENYAAVRTLFGKPTQFDRDLAYRLKPNRAFTLEMEPGDVTAVTLNDQGYRSGDQSATAPIAVYGDSFIFGVGVNDEDVWHHPLRDSLGMEVANYSIFGYHLWQYQRLADRTVANEHTVVVYGIFANDIRLEALEADRPRIVWNRSIAPAKNPFSYTLRRVFIRSPLENLQKLTRVARAGAQSEMPFGYAAACVEWTLDPIRPDYYTDLLNAVIAVAEQHNQTLVITTLPSKEVAHADAFGPLCEAKGDSITYQREAYAFICDYVRQRGHHCYDLTEDFSRIGQNEMLYLPRDGHWNARGHAVYADLLGSYLSENELLP